MAEKQNNRTQIIVECAVLIAIGTILAQIKIYRMPNGGSVTAASLVPFLIIGLRYGTKWGIISGFVNSLLQMLLGGIYPPIAFGALGYAFELLFDYFLAYIVLGFSKAFLFGRPKTLKTVEISAFICLFLRFICAFLSGFLVWADVFSDGWAAVLYSFTYNASYLIPESLITLIVLGILTKAYPKLLRF